MTTVEELLVTLKQLVPELTDEQLEQVAAILRLGMGEPPTPTAEAVEAIEAAGGEVTEEMRAAFGLFTAIDPYKATASLDEILEVINNVVDINEEQLAKLTSVLQLALASAMAEEEALPEEDMLLDEEMLMGDEGMVGEEEIRAIVANAVRSVVGAPSPRPTRAVSRPPYAFSPTAVRDDDGDMSPIRAATRLRFGEADVAVKAIANDLYGDDYELKRYKQAQAFGAYLRHGKEALDHDASRALKAVILTPSQLKAFAFSGMSTTALKTDMADVIDELGEFLVPEVFRIDMIEKLPGLTVVRRYADILSTGSDMMTRVTVTGGDDRYTSAVRVTWVGDVPASGSADTNPTFGVERTPVHICKATIHVPMALMEDTPFPLVQKVNEWVSQAFAIDEDEQFLVGNGIAKPEGILPASGNGHSLTEAISGSASTIEFDGLKTLRYSVARQYRNGAIWIMNDSTAQAASKLKDGEGRYLWELSNQVGEPDRLLGYPVETSEAMPDIAADAYPIIFGNLREGYQIADRIGMSMVRDDVTQAEEDLVKFIFRRRLGAQIKSEWPLAVQKISAT